MIEKNDKELRNDAVFLYDQSASLLEVETNQAVEPVPNPKTLSNDQQVEPFPVKLESGQFTTTGTNSMFPLGQV